MSPSHKRKYGQDGDGDDDNEIIQPGRQVLPVANLPSNFDGVPADGLEYLFTVRRDAQRLPLITRAANPYATSMPAIVLPPTQLTSIKHPALPSEEWRTVHESRFRNFRQNLRQPIDDMPLPDLTSKIMPEKIDRDSWWAFLAGKPESEWNPPPKQQKRQQQNVAKVMPAVDHQVISTPPVEDELVVTVIVPRPPTALLLKHLDQRYSLHLLMYFAHWINQHSLPRITETHAQWIFVLLALVDDDISADNMNMMRNLARAHISLLKSLFEEEGRESATEQPGGTLTKKSCWIIITTIVNVWRQRDLWNDVQDMLKSIPSNSLT